MDSYWQWEVFSRRVRYCVQVASMNVVEDKVEDGDGAAIAVEE